MAMAEKQGTPGADVIDVLVVIRIENVGALAACDEARSSTNTSPCADRRIYSAGDGELSALEELLRSFKFHSLQFTSVVNALDHFEGIAAFLSRDERLALVADGIREIEELAFEGLEGNCHRVGGA